MDGGEEDLQALLGFSSFGRPRKRTRRSNYNNEPSTATSRSGRGSAERGELHDVVPGTETEPLAVGSSAASALRISPHGVALLTKSRNRVTKNKLKEVLDRGVADDAQGPRTDGAMHRWALPSSTMELLKEVSATKARFGALDPKAFALARRRANPYEALGRHRFINRSAMKMANLDFIFQWTQQHQDASSDGDPFVFADVCGGPGGFSEYLLWRMRGHESPQNEQSDSEGVGQVAGFGISLRGMESCDWKVGDKDDEGEPRFKICYGSDGTGDLYKVPNIHSFRDELRRAYPKGAHLVVADGGFPDARDQSNQELMMARLVVAEVLTMFSVLRVGGSFVCKTFELSSPLMLQLMWLLHQCFEEFTIVKPVTSRPASSERYVVAQNLHPDLPLDAICSRLALIVEELEDTDARLQLLRGTIDADVTGFLAFMADASEGHSRQQIQACEKIIASATGAVEEEAEGIDRWRYYRRWRL